MQDKEKEMEEYREKYGYMPPLFANVAIMPTTVDDILGIVFACVSIGISESFIT